MSNIVERRNNVFCMKKKCLIICSLMILIIATIFIVKSQIGGFDSAIAVMCAGEKYVEIEDTGYLTILFDDNKNTRKTLQVKDKTLKKELSNSNINDIIGAHIFLHIPRKVIKEKHIQTESLNSVDFMLNTSEYDRYYEIVGVSYK